MTSTEEAIIEAPVVASHNNYLSEQTNQIRARVVPWEGYQRAALITETELSQLKQFEKSPAAAFAEAGDKNVAMFLTLLGKLVRTDTIQNILVILDDALSENGERVNLFYKHASEKKDIMLIYSVFLKNLKKDDEFIQLKSAKILVLLLSKARDYPNYESISELVTFLTNHVQNNSNALVVDLCVQYLQSLLYVNDYRLPFYKTPNAVGVLVAQLKKATTAQMQYQILYCLWLVSFVPEVSKNLQKKYDVLPCMAEIAKSAIKEKVVRMVASVWKHMILAESKDNIYAFVGNKVPALVDNLCTRKFTDSEITEDLQMIQGELTKIVASLSTFDEYSSEVCSGKLEWSPAHLSEQFWKQNAARLNERDFEILRILSRLMSTSTEPIVLAVAAHDVGQYVKFCPSGRKIVQDIGAKTQIMELMTHQDSDVRYQALAAVQKFMTNSWSV